MILTAIALALAVLGAGVAPERAVLTFVVSLACFAVTLIAMALIPLQL